MKVLELADHLPFWKGVIAKQKAAVARGALDAAPVNLIRALALSTVLIYAVLLPGFFLYALNTLSVGGAEAAALGRFMDGLGRVVAGLLLFTASAAGVGMIAVKPFLDRCEAALKAGQPVDDVKLLRAHTLWKRAPGLIIFCGLMLLTIGLLHPGLTF